MDLGHGAWAWAWAWAWVGACAWEPELGLELWQAGMRLKRRGEVWRVLQSLASL